jgi:hypothetical protein
MGKLLSTREVALRYGWKEQTVRVKRLRGDGPPFVRLSRNRVGYREEDLAAWELGRRFSSTSEEAARTGAAA